MSKIGIMLGGGGAKGAYQVGVIKALDSYGLLDKIEVSSGTSVGAVNTCMLMATRKYKPIADMWTKIDNEIVYSSARDDLKGIYDLDNIKNVLLKYLKVEKIFSSPIKGYATASKIVKGPSTFLNQLNPKHMVKEVFLLNDFHDPFTATIASASIPIAFGTTELDGEFYVDGGLLDNYPLDPLLDEGCDIIFGIPLDERFDIKKYKEHNILYINFLLPNTFAKLFVVDLIDSVKFDKNYKKRVERLGYFTAMHMLNKLSNLNIFHQDNFSEAQNFLVKPEGFTYIDVTSEDESIIRELSSKEEKYNIDVTIKKFNLLKPSEIYEILNVRNNVFVVDQQIYYVDTDFLDPESTFIFYKDKTTDKIVGTLRLIPKTKVFEDAYCFGRFCVLKEYQNKGIGSLILEAALEYFIKEYPEEKLRIHAQSYLLDFYLKYGFVKEGDVFEIEGIPHIEMVYKEYNG
ncbi:MAG: GNAT family N-acetyltransferase [Acholeplasmatales bacterium]|jgi:NTE family protein|nr:GNAT family N-acetyltransferase [Acholeplasmatales bacterium]